ncbi:hypothetical protein [Photobacterium leiognathi]
MVYRSGQFIEQEVKGLSAAEQKITSTKIKKILDTFHEWLLETQNNVS